MDFVIGGTAAMCAGFFSNPFDVIKTRQQLQGELEKFSKLKPEPYRGLWHSAKSIVKAEGVFGLQKGLGSALAFQFVMNSTRLGLFQTVDTMGLTKNAANEHSLPLCVFWGGFTGVAGSSLGCPFFMVKTQIQVQSHGKYAVGYQHQHSGTMNALASTYKQRGVKGLWHGVSGIVPRTAVGSSVQLTTFTMCKDYCLQYEMFKESTFKTAVAASMFSGFFTCVFMTPFDVISTRLFNQGVDANGKGLMYRNIFDCFYKTLKIEGLRGLYKGVVPNYWRIAPHTLLNLTFWEQLKKYKNIFSSEEGKVYFD